MLDFIKKQIGVEPIQESHISDSLLDTDDSLITEYAHLFQELKDVSVEGTEENTIGRGRIGGVDIALEDDLDVEPDTIEMNLMDGRVSDIPADASKKTITTESASADMKTFDDFFEEMYANSTRFERESEENHVSRIRRKANQVYQEYVTKCYQEGLFGFGEMDINDAKVPAAIAFDFGTACGMSQTMVQVPFKYITTERRGKRMITKDQYECAAMLVANPNLTNAIIADFVNIFKQTMAGSIGSSPINEILMFQFIGIPKQTSATEFEIYVAADTGIAGKAEFDMKYIITKPGKRSNLANVTDPLGMSNSVQSVPGNNELSFRLVNPTEADAYVLKNLMTKNECVQLEYVANRPRRFEDSYYQEAIDFGGDEGESSDENTDDSSTSESSEGKNEKKDVDTNDVSDEIVDKVSSDKEDGADDEGNSNEEEGASVGDDGANIDDESTTEDSSENSDDSSVDSELENLDSSLEDESPDLEGDEDPNEDEGGDLSTDDIDNMTIEELLQQGQDKLKGMTLKELKSFVSSIGGDSSSSGSDDAGLPSSDNPDDDNPDASSSEDVELEAFILTSKNINSELEINIRNCLGILNESDISSSEIFKKFKKASKKLNKVSAKASNMSKVYTDDERKTIGDMNKALVNLTLELGSSSKEVASIKEKMKAFVNAAAAVGKIIDSKK